MKEELLKLKKSVNDLRAAIRHTNDNLKKVDGRLEDFNAELDTFTNTFAVYYDEAEKEKKRFDERLQKVEKYLGL